MPFRFETLDCWHDARALSKLIIRATAAFPKLETYGLADQTRRAMTAVVLLVAEGTGLPTPSLFRHRLGLAIGELYEVAAAIILASDRGYLEPALRQELYAAAESLPRKLRRLRSALAPRNGPEQRNRGT